jgi:hypothetical protein
MDDVVLGDVADARTPADLGTANDTVVANFSRRRRLLSSENFQQGGLSCSAATGDGNQLTRFHSQRQLLENLPCADTPAHVDCFDPPTLRCFACVAWCARA